MSLQINSELIANVTEFNLYIPSASFGAMTERNIYCVVNYAGAGLPIPGSVNSRIFLTTENTHRILYPPATADHKST